MYQQDEKINYTTTKIKQPRRQMWQKLMIRFDKDISFKYTNCGFHHLEEKDKISLLEKDENDRYYIQLYEHIIKEVDVYYKDILEIGSGRGGGSSYINRYYDPKSLTGLESSKATIDFCKRYYSEPGLKFVNGELMNLPFENESFDIIISVESFRFNNKCLSIFK